METVQVDEKLVVKEDQTLLMTNNVSYCNHELLWLIMEPGFSPCGTRFLALENTDGSLSTERKSQMEPSVCVTLVKYKQGNKRP